jgi:hypothetical protein
MLYIPHGAGQEILVNELNRGDKAKKKKPQDTRATTRELIFSIPPTFWDPVAFQNRQAGVRQFYYGALMTPSCTEASLREGMAADVLAIEHAFADEGQGMTDEDFWMLAYLVGVLTEEMPKNRSDQQAVLILYLKAEYLIRIQAIFKDKGSDYEWQAPAPHTPLSEPDLYLWNRKDRETYPAFRVRYAANDDDTKQQPDFEPWQMRDLELLTGDDSRYNYLRLVQPGNRFNHGRVRIATPFAGGMQKARPGFRARGLAQYLKEIDVLEKYYKKIQNAPLGATVRLSNVSLDFKEDTVTALLLVYESEWKSKAIVEKLASSDSSPEERILTHSQTPIQLNTPGLKKERSIISLTALSDYLVYTASEGPWSSHLRLSATVGNGDRWKYRMYIALRIQAATPEAQETVWKRVVSTTTAGRGVQWLTTWGQELKQSFWFGVWLPKQVKGVEERLYDTPQDVRKRLDDFEIAAGFVDEEMYKALPKLPLPYCLRAGGGQQYRVLSGEYGDGLRNVGVQLLDIESRRVIAPDSLMPNDRIKLTKADLAAAYTPIVYVRRSTTVKPTPAPAPAPAPEPEPAPAPVPAPGFLQRLENVFISPAQLPAAVAEENKAEPVQEGEEPGKQTAAPVQEEKKEEPEEKKTAPEEEKKEAPAEQKETLLEELEDWIAPVAAVPVEEETPSPSVDLVHDVNQTEDILQQTLPKHNTPPSDFDLCFMLTVVALL